MSLFRSFLKINARISKFINLCLPAGLSVDGNQHFRDELLPSLIRSGMVIYDLGGGSRPCVDLEKKSALKLTVIGLDISEEELLAAPAGVYDRIIVQDLCKFEGNGDGDLAVCQSAMEHVPSTKLAMRGISSCLKPNGRAAVFAPNKNAIFARMNLVLPQNFKERILYALFPHKAEGHDGFPAFYDKCTPNEFQQMAREEGMEIEHRKAFWMSSYFTIFFPAFLVWRVWQAIGFAIVGAQASETFWLVLRKTPDPRKI